MIRRCFEWSPRTALTVAAVLIALIAYADWRLEFNATLGRLTPHRSAQQPQVDQDDGADRQREPDDVDAFGHGK